MQDLELGGNECVVSRVAERAMRVTSLLCRTMIFGRMRAHEAVG
jgi:hypothetical protein